MTGRGRAGRRSRSHDQELHYGAESRRRARALGLRGTPPREGSRFPDGGGPYGAPAHDPIVGWYQPDAVTTEMPILEEARHRPSSTVVAPPPTTPPPSVTPPPAPDIATRRPPPPEPAVPPRWPPEAPPPAEAPPSPRRASFLVAAGILASRFAGLVRESVIGFFLGTTPAADAFKAALRIPNLMQNLLGEGVLSASFIPVYSKLRAEGDERAAGRLAGSTAGLLLVLTGLLSLIGVVFAAPITRALVTGFGSGPRFDLTVSLVRIMFPGIGFLVLSAWCLGVLNSHRKFFLSYVAPVLWNAAQIAVLVVVGLAGFNQRSMAVALAWGVLLGGFLQLGVQLPLVIRLLGRVRLNLSTRDGPIRTVIARFGPVVMARGVVQIMGFVDLLLASFLAAGAISSLTFAQVLYLLPISVFGMSVAAAELPDLSTLDVSDAQSRRDFRRRLETGLARIFFYVAPTATVFIVAGDVIVDAIFGRGQMTQGDVRLIWLTIAAFSLGLPAMTASRLLQNALYGMGDARTPARLAAIRVFVAALIGLALMFPLDRLTIVDGRITGWGDMLALGPLGAVARDNPAGIPHLGILGLAIGAAISAWIEYRLLSTALAWRIGRSRIAGRWLNPIAGACVGMAIVAFLTAIAFGGLPALLTAPLVLVPTGLTYLALTRWLRVPEARALTDRAVALAQRA